MFTLHDSPEDLEEILEIRQLEAEEETITKSPVDMSGYIKYLIFGLMGLAMVFMFSNMSHKTTEMASSKSTISGKIIEKKPGSAGAIILVLSNPDLHSEYRVILSSDMDERFSYHPGSTIQVKGSMLNDDIYSVADAKDIKVITSIQDYHIIKDVVVNSHVGTFQYGDGLSKLYVEDYPDGVYKYMMIAKTSDGHIQILKAE